MAEGEVGGEALEGTIGEGGEMVDVIGEEVVLVCVCVCV